MNKLLSLSSLLLFSNVYGQTDYGCNHYGSSPVDVCYQYSSSYDYMVYCNGTTNMVSAYYTQGEECSDDSFLGSISYSFGTSSECGNEDNCGYFQVICDSGSYIFQLTDVCETYYEYSCSGTDGSLTLTTYAESGCSGSSSSADYTYYQTAYPDCTFACVEGAGSGSSANTLSIQFALLFSFLAVFAKLF